MNKIVNLQNGLSTLLEDIVEKVAEATTERVMKRIEERMDRKQPNKQYTREEVCKLLRVSKVTLNNWANNGKLVPVKVGNRVLYDEDKVNEALGTNIKYAR